MVEFSLNLKEQLENLAYAGGNTLTGGGLMYFSDGINFIKKAFKHNRALVEKVFDFLPQRIIKGHGCFKDHADGTAHLVEADEARELRVEVVMNEAHFPLSKALPHSHRRLFFERLEKTYHGRYY